jgi:polar amino acid transport system ATP-binding protein
MADAYGVYRDSAGEAVREPTVLARDADAPGISALDDMPQRALDQPILRIEAVSKRFGQMTVLHEIDLDVHQGEKITLIGPSGAGKSTLLRCVNYLERPSSGHIYLDGEPVGERFVKGRFVPAGQRELAGVRRHIGMVFQHFHLYPHLTAVQNVTLGLTKVLRLSKAEADDRAMALLERVGLAEKRHVHPDRLSGGQQQRVAIARALAMEPRIMLFDEATSALDPELAAEVLTVMRQLAAEGMTMLIVTHEMHFAADVSDRVIFMADGRILEQGRPQEVFRAPRHERTRRFLKAVIER